MRACAYIVGPDEGPGAALRDLARQIGFEAVQPYRGLARAERQAQLTPLVYFLFASVERPQTLKPAADEIRSAHIDRLRFSPLIYFSESPSLEVIRSCINMGFDDIITLPFTLARLEERLLRQTERPLVYYETATYFGPDRRGRLDREEGHSLRGTGGQHRRMEIVRTVAGISVLRDDQQIVV